MRTNRIALASSFLLVAMAAMINIACDVGTTGADKVIASTKAGEMNISVASAAGELKHGENELYLAFADASGNGVDVGAASLSFHMPAMIGMAEMNDVAALTTTELAGRYRAHVTIEAAGTWEAIVNYQGAHGQGQVRMSVNAR